MRNCGAGIDDVQRPELDIGCERRVVQDNVARIHRDPLPVSGDRRMDEIWERQSRVLAKTFVQCAQPRWLANGNGHGDLFRGLREPLVGSSHGVTAHRLGNELCIGSNVAE